MKIKIAHVLTKIFLSFDKIEKYVSRSVLRLIYSLCCKYVQALSLPMSFTKALVVER